MRRGEKAEKNVTAIPRQAGYLETVRAMYEYTYYKDDEEVAQARGMSTSPWARSPFSRKPTTTVWRALSWWGVRGVSEA